MTLALVALLVAACGPMAITPTPQEGAAQDAATTAPTENTATAAPEEPTGEEATTVAELPVDGDDWHVLGSPDAEVTIVEYSDFQ
jgi:protein-disulfide isomerase